MADSPVITFAASEYTMNLLRSIDRRARLMNVLLAVVFVAVILAAASK